MLPESVRERDASELFGLVVPIVLGLFTVALVLLDGEGALYTGLVVGVGLVLLAGVLGSLDVRRRDTVD